MAVHPLVIAALNLASAAAAFVAAFHWYKSATLMVLYDPSKDDGSANIIMDAGDKQYDFFATGRARDTSSRNGALFAGIAAALQGVVFVVSGLVA